MALAEKGPVIIRLVTTGKLHLLEDDREVTICGHDARRGIPETTTDQATETQMENLCANCVLRWGQKGIE